MLLEVKVPEIAAEQDIIKLVSWYVKDRDFVEEEASLCLLETHKASFEVVAEKKGFVKIMKAEGEVVSVSEIICVLADSPEEL